MSFTSTRAILTFLVTFICAFLSGCAIASFELDAEDRSPAMSAEAEERHALRMQMEQMKQAQIRRARDNRDVILGMRQEDVLYVWGHPGEVAVAGNRSDGNEKWVYYEGLSRRAGLGQARVIYFEQGEVVGWESASAN
jgi:hypothetical protein